MVPLNLWELPLTWVGRPKRPVYPQSTSFPWTLWLKAGICVTLSLSQKCPKSHYYQSQCCKGGQWYWGVCVCVGMRQGFRWNTFNRTLSFFYCVVCFFNILYCVVFFSSLVVSDSLQAHGLQHARLPCPLSPRGCSNSCPLSQWCHPTISSSVTPFSSCLPSFSIKGFSSESALHIRWPKYWSFSFSSSNEYSGLISFRIDWFDALAVQGTLKSLLQHHSSKALILQCSAFYMIQLWYPFMTTAKTIALTIQTFVSKGIYLLFNMLSRFVIDFLPRSKRLLISWLQSPSAVILEPKKVKSVTVSIFSPSICHEDGPGCHDLSFLNVEF